MILFGLVELNDGWMPGELHVHDLVFYLLHERGSVVIQGHLLEIDDLEGAGYFSTVIEAEKHLSKGSLTEFLGAAVGESFCNGFNLKLLHLYRL